MSKDCLRKCRLSYKLYYTLKYILTEKKSGNVVMLLTRLILSRDEQSLN